MYKCIKETIFEQKTLVMRKRCSVEDLPATLGATYGEIMNYLISIDKQASGMPFIAYYNMDMSNMDLAIGFPISEDIAEKDGIIMDCMPAGDYAVTMHIGAYDKLNEAYSAISEWMAEQKLMPVGVVFELYLNDPGAVLEEALETKIMFLLK